MDKREFKVKLLERTKGPYGELWRAVVAFKRTKLAAFGGKAEVALHFSRYDTETEWLCDAQFGTAGVPIYVHGTGSRSCRKSAAAEWLAAELNALVEKAILEGYAKAVTEAKGGLI